MKKIKKLLLFLVVPILLLLMIFIAMFGGDMSNSSGGVSDKNNLSEAVEKYRPYVEKIAKTEGMSEYTDLILSVMQVESGGTGNDPMQSSEGPFNKKFPQVPNGITSPEYSILCGIRELKDCLKRAGVSNKGDEAKIRVALGGYNFGNGFIEWLQKNKQGKWTLSAAEEFSSMMADKLGWSAYGDPPYADKVMSYYNTIGFITGDGDFIAPLRSYVLTNPYGSGFNGFHYGVDISGGFGAPVYAPMDSVVYRVSNTCPSSGGSPGNMCPYNEYMGGGNYVQLKVRYKNKDLYIFLCHMKNADVRAGQKIKKGQRIGAQGNSGNSSGSHVHIEIHEGTPRVGTMDGIIDPARYIKFEGAR